ncbi:MULTISPECIES: polyphosphate polymerase domain-containing protein [unclassified Modestobacter]
MSGGVPALRSVARLPTVGLEELVARAALQTRIDRKYVLPLAGADQFLADLARTEEVRVLEMAGLRAFGYESLYLDTPELTGYHLAARGRRRRFKVRRRTYLDTGTAFLEVKTRGPRGTTVKERIPATGDRQSASAFVDDVLQRAGLGTVRSDELRPVLRTAYRRTTLHLPATDGRVTVDTDLMWSLPGGPVAELVGVALVETKSGSAPSAADRRLWRSGQRPSRISKYGTGLAALRGDLPDNKWCPVLRRHFSLLTPCSSDDRNLP